MCLRLIKIYKLKSPTSQVIFNRSQCTALLEPSDTVLYKLYNLQSWLIFSEVDKKIVLTVCICGYLCRRLMSRISCHKLVLSLRIFGSPPPPSLKPLESFGSVYKHSNMTTLHVVGEAWTYFVFSFGSRLNISG